MNTVDLTSFIRINYQDLIIKRMQIGDPALVYKQLSDNSSIRPHINIHISSKINTTTKKMFLNEDTGYFSVNNALYYRNCNVISNLAGGEVFYKGKLPNSYAAVKLQNRGSTIDIEINVTKIYLMESESRFTRNSPFEIMLNNIILISSILIGKIPMHAAAIEVGDCSYLFMGLPNTGKTTTSTAITRLLHGNYLSEDILFIDVKTLKVFSCPFTSKVIQSDKYEGGKLKKIVLLKRTLKAVEIKKINKDELMDNLINMNFYEFNWGHDPIVKGLLVGEDQFSQKTVQKLYYDGMAAVSSQINGYILSGENPEKWAGFLKKHIEEGE